MDLPIREPGLFSGIPVEVYHADPVVEPSLSSSLGKLILKSPLHAFVRHPRLCPEPIREEKDVFDLGSAAHALMLGEGAAFRVVDASDWRAKEAKDAKASARASGKIPILKSQFERTERMVASCRQWLAQSEAPEAFDLAKGKSEQVLVWQERGGVWCRAMLDWAPNDLDDGAILYDLKTTKASAHPGDWGGRTAWGIGADFQAAFYLRGLRNVFGIEARLRFVVVELDEPHGCSIVELTPAALALADRKVDRAIEIWRQCRAVDVWPGYPPRVAYVDPPPWMEADWLAREEREPLDDNLVERMVDWHRPLEEVT